MIDEYRNKLDLFTAGRCEIFAIALGDCFSMEPIWDGFLSHAYCRSDDWVIDFLGRHRVETKKEMYEIYYGRDIELNLSVPEKPECRRVKSGHERTRKVMDEIIRHPYNREYLLERGQSERAFRRTYSLALDHIRKREKIYSPYEEKEATLVEARSALRWFQNMALFEEEHD